MRIEKPVYSISFLLPRRTTASLLGWRCTSKRQFATLECLVVDLHHSIFPELVSPSRSVISRSKYRSPSAVPRHTYVQYPDSARIGASQVNSPGLCLPSCPRAATFFLRRTPLTTLISGSPLFSFSFLSPTFSSSPELDVGQSTIVIVPPLPSLRY